jgi:hypothetical protein
MSNSIRERLGTHNPAVSVYELRKLLEAAQADLAAIRASVVAITAKLDLDAGVTDTNYAANCNPAVLTLTA